MRIGIVGFPLAGKSTVFSLLTGTPTQITWGGKTEAHVGIAQVPDENLERLAKIFNPKKITYATVEYVDLPGWTRGADGAQARDVSSYLSNLKNVDALLHVVRAFRDESIPHTEGPVDPARDVALLEMEMILSDLAIAERRLERLDKDLKKSKIAELVEEQSVLQRVREALEREEPLRSLSWTEEEQKKIRGFTFLSAKPLLVLVNLGDDDVRIISSVAEAYGLDTAAIRGPVVVTGVCGKIESEIAMLSGEDSETFMNDLGFPGSGMARIIRDSYELLGLISFYTAGEQEVRAWTIARGATAIQAAGAIHSDFERGFIKAEVVTFEDIMKLGSFQAARSQGLLRLEGKDYPLQEGDVVLFRFNV